MQMQLHNYTPHQLTIRCGNGDNSDLPSEGSARVGQTSGARLATYLLGADHEVPVYGPSIYGAVTDLPDPQPGHGYIVSMMVAQALPDRADLLVPGTGPADGAIREQGNIVAVTRLIAPNAR